MRQINLLPRTRAVTDPAHRYTGDLGYKSGWSRDAPAARLDALLEGARTTAHPLRLLRHGHARSRRPVHCYDL